VTKETCKHTAFVVNFTIIVDEVPKKSNKN